jgi:acetoacetyl-CoA reductase/3-oxoacyl-[acyl-carrier protein] reductase
MQLSGKTAIITGATGGIGKAIATLLHSEGANIVICYYKSKKEGAKLHKELENSILVYADLNSSSSISKLVSESCRQFGSVDILVNNAGYLHQQSFETIKEEEWDYTLSVNLKSAFLLCQKVIPLMEKQKFGRIVNISSIGGQWGGNLAVHYAVSKAGLISLTKSLAKIYSKHNILTNCIAPGLIDTKMIEKEIDTKEGKEKIAQIPVKRIGTPQEVAKAVLFLVSDASSYITGQTINLNGGMYFG